MLLPASAKGESPPNDCLLRRKRRRPSWIRTTRPPPHLRSQLKKNPHTPAYQRAQGNKPSPPNPTACR
ncbi:GDSL Lipase/Acylhydrolase [Histoplasma capsulatum]|uniref:GDSL Lipase/Acylhydrolase n=1 Tax=Ajellomyces capsulatus TaxID=5037 RepID=A0A8A1MHD1_AJECA|nr:GDSL Lipase/Acylhydrolase [Histoplasma capsulatum]